jgi:transcriptional regulator with XRE-family HTH domain
MSDLLRNKLRRWRVENDLTLAEVADLTGLSEAMISRVERGQRRLAPLTKVRVSRRLGVSISDLFDVEEVPDGEAVAGKA